MNSPLRRKSVAPGARLLHLVFALLPPALLACSSTNTPPWTVHQLDNTAVGRTIHTPARLASGPSHPNGYDLGDGCTLNLAPNTAVLLTSKSSFRSVSLERGRIHLDCQTAPQRSSFPIVLQSGDVEIHPEVASPSALTFRTDDSKHLTLTAIKGILRLFSSNQLKETLRSGDTLQLADGEPLKPQANWKQNLQPISSAFGKTPEAPTLARNRGLGKMKANIPGNSASVSGVRLSRHHLRVLIHDGFARTEVQEEFVNDTDQILEGRFSFVAPAGASISRLALSDGDKLQEAEIVDKTRATIIFDAQANDPATTHSPALLEWAGSDLNLRVFPLEQKRNRRVILAYNQILKRESNQLRYVYPLSLTDDQSAALDEISVSIDAKSEALGFNDATVEGYPATVSNYAGQLRVKTILHDVRPTQDFVVSFRTTSNDPIQASFYTPQWGESKQIPLVERAKADRETSYAAFRISVHPLDISLPFRPGARDWAFIIDRSHRQKKENLATEKRITLELLRAMAPDETFVVLACDSACSSFPESGQLASTPENHKNLAQWLDKTTAQGASDPARSILTACSKLKSGGRGQIVYLGSGNPGAGELDGEAGGRLLRGILEQSKLDLRLVQIETPTDNNWFSSFARFAGATFETFAKDQAFDNQVATLALHLRSPIFRFPSVSVFEDLEDIYPKDLPNLRIGEEITLVGKLIRKQAQRLTLRGEIQGQKVEVTKTIEWVDDPKRQNPLLPRLWAASAITELEKSGGNTIKLSRDFHVLAKSTALLVLENNETYALFGIPKTQIDSFAGINRITSSSDDSPKNAPLHDLGSGGTRGPSPLGVLDAQPYASGAVGLASVGAAPKALTSDSPKTQGAHCASPPSLRTVSLTSSGGKIDRLAEILRQSYGRFRLCYESGLRRDNNLAGQVSFNFLIDTTGTPHTPRIDLSTLHDPNVVQCVRQAIRGLSFPRPKTPVQVKLTLAFAPDASPRLSNKAIDTRIYDSPIEARKTNSSIGTRGSDTAIDNPPRLSFIDGDEKWRELESDNLKPLRDAVDKSPENPTFCLQLFRSLILNGRFEEALTQAKRLVELTPDFAESHELLAQTYALNGEFENAAIAFAALAALSPLDLSIQSRVAIAYENIGDDIRACAHWRSVRALNPLRWDREERCGIGSPIGSTNLDHPHKAIKQFHAEKENGDPRGILEAQLVCDVDSQDCPVMILMDPQGQVWSTLLPPSPQEPNVLKSPPLTIGTYRVLLVGSSEPGKGFVKLTSDGATQIFPFENTVSRTIAFAKYDVVEPKAPNPTRRP